MWKVHSNSVAYAATTLAATMMHSVFMFYYVTIYLNRFHVSENWFQFAQVVFMIWNAFNDPLFGYIQDNYDFSWVKSRRHSILYGAPLWALSFLIPWFPWGDYEAYTWLSGVQLTISLCFYDAMFTFVLLAQCSLFAEMSTAQDDRVRLVKYTQIASLIGSSSVFFTGYTSANLDHYGAFQTSCIVIGLFAWLFLTYSGRYTYSQYDKTEKSKGNGNHKHKDESEALTSGKSAEPQYTALQQIRQIMSERDFLSFVLMNFCQVYHVNFLMNFAKVFCDVLMNQDDLPTAPRSFFYGSLTLSSQLLLVMFTPVVRRVGYYKLARYSFVVKIVMGCWMMLFGQHWWGIVVFFFIDCLEANATFSLFNLPLSDVIDVDKEKYRRRTPLSSMVFGTNALITKPAQSLAPMITVAVLNRYGYGSIDRLAGPSAASEELRWAMVMVCGGTSVLLGALQAVIWSFYTIRDSHNTISKYVET